MFTTDERRALVFLAVVTAVGAAFRATHGAVAPGAATAAVAPELAGGDLVHQAALSQRAQTLSRPLAPGERVDVDRAPADELQRLPRVGPALARRIVEEREAHGPFGSLEGLRRVSGIGPKLLHDLEAHVTFDGVPPEPAATASFATTTGIAAVGLPAARSARQGSSGSVWVSVSAPTPPRPSAGSPGCAHPPDLNHATVAELVCLPGVGQVLAERLVAERTAHGPFRDIADLARVKGFGAARIRRLKDSVTIP